MESHEREPDLIPANDLILSLTGPYVAGLDTVASTTAACLYAVLKHPEVLERIHREVDAFFAEGPIEEEQLFCKRPRQTAPSWRRCVFIPSPSRKCERPRAILSSAAGGFAKARYYSRLQVSRIFWRSIIRTRKNSTSTATSGRAQSTLNPVSIRLRPRAAHLSRQKHGGSPTAAHHGAAVLSA